MQNKIKNLIAKMTLFEKASLCSGKDFWTTKPINRLGIPSIVMSDGPHGLRKENNEDTSGNVAMKNSFPATSFPPAVNMASTWNPDLITKVGKALGEQCLNQGVEVILGPGTNIKRSPLCGRNFEYFSEDPFLAGKMCVGYINGVESTGAGTSLKHFAVNNQESMRMTISAVVDERTLRELYLAPFEMAVKNSKPTTIMCSYNRINGVYSSDNKRLLTDILRDEWGYDGLVVSDWNAVSNRVQGIKAGMDLEMPSCGGRTDKEIVKAVLSGELKEEELDVVVERLLKFILKAEKAKDDGYFYNYREGHTLARKVADESIVLLKNEKNILPIDHREKITVIGSLAETIRYQGSGSSRINPYYLVSFFDYLNSHKLEHEYKQGYKLSDNGYDEQLFNEAVETAKAGGKIVLFVGLTDSYECEGYDRKDLSLPESHSKLIEAISEVNDNLTVILLGGSPVEMPWIDKVHTLINAYLPGEAAGESIADILYGIVNPSGKLAETYPVHLEYFIGSQYYKGGPKTTEHREGMFVGYRYYDTAKKDVLFPFGYGLSYTTFGYSNLHISNSNIKDTDTVDVTFTVTNTGAVDGAEIAQLYVRDVESTVYRPLKELKGFKKVFLPAGASEVVTITLDKRSFAYYNVDIKDWTVESGEFEIMIGASSRDIKLSAIINVESTVNVAHKDMRETAPCYYNLDTATEVTDSEFEAVYGSTLPSNKPSLRGEFDLNTTIGELRCCAVGQIFCKLAPPIIKSQMPDADFTTMLMLQQGMEEMPLRGLNGVTSGLLDNTVIEGLLLWGNKHRFKGLCKAIKGMFFSIKNIRNINHNPRIKIEKQRIKEEQKCLMEEQKIELKEHQKTINNLKKDMDTIKKFAKDEETANKYLTQHKQYIEAYEKKLSEHKAQNKEVLLDKKDASRQSIESIRAEEKEIRKALRDYLKGIDDDSVTTNQSDELISLLKSFSRKKK